tara:strand:+ start:551 stop:754 length:204 start_codon:yes stop_codon:yes gene_type:complete
MTTAAWAVQPATWTNFDEHGCDWATDINHAYRIAQAWQEDCIIWRIPNSGGAPMRWVRCGDDTAQAI